MNDSRNTRRGRAATEVAQNCILLYRGFLIRLGVGRASAECNSAIRQIENLRYNHHSITPLYQHG